MRVLLVNKFHYLKGGSEKYYFELGKLLENKGHEVAFFSMKDEKNISTGNKEFFTDKIDLNNANKLKCLEVIYSRRNYKKMINAIEEFKPDVIHLNNFQRQLSSSVVMAAKHKEIPIVYTAHDVQAICPAITMLDSNKKICELCMNGKYVNCVRKKCNKNSTLKSIIGAIEGMYYRKRKIYEKKINVIITPTNFYKEKFIQDGINADKIYSLHNFINLDEYNCEIEDEGYALYVGRLSEEKGIINLIKAFKKSNRNKLYIAGDGPDKDRIVEYIKNEQLEEKIKLLGYLKSNEIKEYVRKCRFVVVPSIWYENCPYSILETLSIGKPIVGSRIGGIPELVIDNKTGLLFDATSIEDLSNKMNLLFDNENMARELGINAKKYAEDNFSMDNYYNNIIKIYENCINQKK